MSVLTFDHTFAGDESSLTKNVPLSIDYMFYAVGDFGGGLLSLEASPNGGLDWFTVEELDEPGRLIRYLVSGETIRLTLVGATSPDVTAGIRQ
jgi:hypothetical protein